MQRDAHTLHILDIDQGWVRDNPWVEASVFRQFYKRHFANMTICKRSILQTTILQKKFCQRTILQNDNFTKRQLDKRQFYNATIYQILRQFDKRQF